MGLVALGVAALTWLPFIPYGGISDYLRDLDYYQNGIFPILSVRAWNPWWLVQTAFADGAFLADSTPWLGPVTPRYLGVLLTGLAEAVILVSLARRATPERLYLGLAAATLVAFCLMTSMHERYAYAALVFLAPLLGRRFIQAVWGILAVAISLNLVAAVPPDQLGPTLPDGGIVGVIGSIAMIVATVVVFALLLGDRSAESDLPPRGALHPADTNASPSR